MKIKITDEVAQWYKDEFLIDKPTHLRFFVRYGFGGLIPGFSLGVSEDEPKQIHTATRVNDITFFVEETDAWYFEGKDLSIKLNKTRHEPEFLYH